MSPLTILRIEKLKTFGNVALSDDHVTRNRETPNADPTRENVRLIGGEDERALEEIVKEKISTLKHLPRKDAVLCTEMFLSASPEYFRPDNPSLSGQWSNERMQQWAIASRDWLDQNYGSKCVRAERAAIAFSRQVAAEIIKLEPRTPFQPPIEDKTKWEAVSGYLTQKRGIPSNFVEVLHNRGLVYADAQQNAVFVMRNLGEEPQSKGAFLRGTRGENNTFLRYEKGTKRREGWFHFHLGGQPTDPVEKVVLLKSPIDAVSFAMLEYQLRGDVPPNRTLYMAVDNPKSLPVEQLQHIPNLQVAFDSDDSGNAAARVVKELLPQSKRLKCKADDWNQQLIDYGQQLKQQVRREHRQSEDLSL